MSYKSTYLDERREAPRLKAYVEGWADPGGVHPAIPCRVLDLSRTGAKVECNSDLPENFILVLGGVHHPAEVVWRRQNQIGVAFRREAPVPAAEAQGAISRAPSQSPG